MDSFCDSIAEEIKNITKGKTVDFGTIEEIMKRYEIKIEKINLL